MYLRIILLPETRDLDENTLLDLDDEAGPVPYPSSTPATAWRFLHSPSSRSRSKDFGSRDAR